MTIQAQNITWRVGQKVILDDVSLQVPQGQMLGLLGPNGSGKSSLLRILAGLRRPHGGGVTLDGCDLRQIKRRDLARRLSFVEQHATTDANVRVEEVVRLGRIPHSSALSGWQMRDTAAVQTALARVGMADRGAQGWQSLSGGERQRVHIARALAQEPSEMLLDEPTNHLDIQHQLELLHLIRSLSLTSVVALHDLNHAAMFCDQLVVMSGGRIVASGTPEAVLTPDLLRDIFRVKAEVAPSAHHGKPHIQFLR